MTQATIFEQRRAGILLHITSLPSASLGQDAYQFVDFLQSAGITVWQMLPLGPTHGDRSPYQCLSAHAGSPYLICLQQVQALSWCQVELDDSGIEQWLPEAYHQFEQYAVKSQLNAFEQFCEQQQFWLEDYVLFGEIRHRQGFTAWFNWPLDIRTRQTAALDEIRQSSARNLMIRRFEQYLFFSQWSALRQYANERDVKLFGDMPIFVAHDSADVWAEPDLFTLDKQGQPTRVAGVPPDYFSETGQRWGNPLYQWSTHQNQDFDWWRRRMQTQLALFDLIRIDHFRGFEACWEIPASCETAIEGKWVAAPGEQLFDSLRDTFGELPLVAEDLGIITDEVTALRQRYGMPGMKILQFAFGGDASNPYLPHQHCPQSIAYTGTHDNNTTLGWYQTLDEHTKAHFHQYAGLTDEEMPWLLIRMALQSVAVMAVVPMQDVLALDETHRMNRPGTIEGNWHWQFQWEWLNSDLKDQLLAMNRLYGRV